MTKDVFKGYGVEVKLKTPEDFLKIRETLTRIGIENHKDKILMQSCHILHKQGRYAIIHFHELYAMDGRSSKISTEDLHRRNAIVSLLEEWNLVEVLDENKIEDQVPIREIRILSFAEKKDYTLKSNYHFTPRTDVRHGM